MDVLEAVGRNLLTFQFCCEIGWSLSLGQIHCAGPNTLHEAGLPRRDLVTAHCAAVTVHFGEC